MKSMIQVFHPFGSGRGGCRCLVFSWFFLGWAVLMVLGLFFFVFPLWAEEQAELSSSWEVPGCSRSSKQWDRCLELARDAYARGETEIAYIRTHWEMMADLAGKRWDELSDYSNKNLVLKVSEERLQSWAKVCGSGDLLACFLVADGYEMRKDFEQAVKYYEMMCSFGSAVGCNGLGWRYANGEGVPEDDRRAAELYRKACDMGSAVGCYNLGWMYEKGGGVEIFTGQNYGKDIIVLFIKIAILVAILIMIRKRYIFNKGKYAESLFVEGLALLELGRYEEALKCYEELIKINPNYAEVWYAKGVVLRSLGRNEDAIKCYDEAIKINPNYAEAWVGKGMALANLGRNEDALKCYDEAIKINPNYAQAWAHKGFALLKLGIYDDEAIKRFDEAIKIDPNYAQAWVGKGSALLKLGRYDEAIKCFDEAIKIDPNYAAAWYGKGIALLNLGRDDEANECFDEAMRINPDEIGQLLRTFQGYEEEGD